jgi:hypothetical protein
MRQPCPEGIVLDIEDGTEMSDREIDHEGLRDTR